MKNKTKLKVAGASALGLGALGLGALAFFSDEISMEKDSKVGTVSVDGEISMTHTQLKRDVLAQYLYFANEPNSLDLDDGMTVEEQREAIKELFEEAPDNLNPGDNEHIYTGYGEEASRPGTDHEINVTVENTGSKSILTRVLVEIEGTAADKTVLTKEDLSRVHVYFDSHNTISGISSIHENYWDWLDYLCFILFSSVKISGTSLILLI